MCCGCFELYADYTPEAMRLLVHLVFNLDARRPP